MGILGIALQIKAHKFPLNLNFGAQIQLGICLVSCLPG